MRLLRFRFDEYDVDYNDTLIHELKLSALDCIETEWRNEMEKGLASGSSYYPSYSSWMAYGTSFIGTIVENLQIEIRDVHIRYEDDISFPARPFSCGFFVESLSAQTCDENWSRKFVHRDHASAAATAFKLVEIQNTAVYLNTEDEMLGGLSMEELSVCLTRISAFAQPWLKVRLRMHTGASLTFRDGK